jgi:hypothetical protein
MTETDVVFLFPHKVSNIPSCHHRLWVQLATTATSRRDRHTLTQDYQDYHTMTDGSLRIPQLTRDSDFQSWAIMMKAYLITQDRLDRHLSATPSSTDTAGLGKDVLCKARLQLHVAGPLQSIVARATSAKEAWDALQADYEGSLRTRTPQLTAQLTSFSQKGDSIVTYCDRLLHLRDQFEALKMNGSLPLLAHQFVRGLRDDVRLATASSLHAVY